MTAPLLAPFSPGHAAAANARRSEGHASARRCSRSTCWGRPPPNRELWERTAGHCTAAAPR
eukprot:13747425-Alexandrium_andersonii.AAC.1